MLKKYVDMRTYEKAAFENQKQPSADAESARALILDFHLP